MILVIITIYSLVTSLICGNGRDNWLDTNYLTGAIDSSLSFAAYFGMIYSLTGLVYYIKRKYYSNSNFDSLNYYYKNSNKKWYISYGVRLLILGLCFLPYMTNLFKVRNPKNLIIIDIFGFAVPMFFYGFFSFGVYYFLSIKLNIANKNIYIIKEENLDNTDNINQETPNIQDNNLLSNY